MKIKSFPYYIYINKDELKIWKIQVDLNVLHKIPILIDSTTAVALC